MMYMPNLGTKPTKPLWIQSKKHSKAKAMPCDSVAFQIERAQSKEDLPLLSLPRNVLALDIDDKPNNYTYQQLENELHQVCLTLFEPDSFAIVTTASGKRRLIVEADFPEGVMKWTRKRVEFVIDNLEMRLPFSIARCIDINGSLNQCIYIANKDTLQKYMKLNRRQIKWMRYDIHVEEYQNRFRNLEYEEDTNAIIRGYRYSKTKVQKSIMKGVSKTSKGYKTYRQFLLMLNGMPALLDGFSLSLKKVASTIGVSTTTASKYIKRACSAGIIECTDERYARGVKAKTYQLVCKFSRKLAKQARDAEARKNRKDSYKGVFNQFLVKTIFNFGSLVAAVEHYIACGCFQASPSKARERMRQVERTWRWSQKALE